MAKRKRRNRNCSSIPTSVFLPENVVSEILARLPVKFLLRCKSVCRLWREIINSQTFIQKHHNTNTSTCLLLYLVRDLNPHNRYEEDSAILIRCSVFPRPEKTLRACKDLEPGRVPGPIQSMLGPCNGIFCVRRWDSRFAFWNPATGCIRDVPDCPPNETAYGFGIDPLTSALKIVVIPWEWDQDFWNDKFAVYDSISDSWGLGEDETLPEFDSKWLRSYGFSDGFGYWLKPKGNNFSILAFDMRDDSFQDMTIPDNIIKPGYEAKLDSYNGGLALISYNLRLRCIETWFMKERGCWEQLSSVCLSFEITNPTGILKRNQIYALCEYRYRLIIYDTDSGSERTFNYKKPNNKRGGFCTYNNGLRVLAHPFKESLAPV